MKTVWMSFREISLLVSLIWIAAGCASVPTVSHHKYDFPKENVFVDLPKVPRGMVIEKLGLVRAKVNFPSFDPEHPDADGEAYCRNYYNQAAQHLYEYAKDKGGEKVMQVRSVVFYMDGKNEVFKSPECSDDGEEGQILLQGIAIRFKKVVSETSVNEK